MSDSIARRKRCWCSSFDALNECKRCDRLLAIAVFIRRTVLGSVILFALSPPLAPRRIQTLRRWMLTQRCRAPPTPLPPERAVVPATRALSNTTGHTHIHTNEHPHNHTDKRPTTHTNGHTTKRTNSQTNMRTHARTNSHSNNLSTPHTINAY